MTSLEAGASQTGAVQLVQGAQLQAGHLRALFIAWHPHSRKKLENCLFSFFFSLFFSPQTGTIVLDMIIPIRQLDFFGMLDSCLRTNTLWGSRLWRRLEKALPLREQIREVLQLLFHVLG